MTRLQKWNENYQLLEEYYMEHGNIDVPHNYKTEDGIKLGIWLTTQRQAYKKQGNYAITEDQIQLLNDLGMKWELREAKWDENYYLLEEYYKEHGNIDVPLTYKTEDGVKLGRWLATQRRAHKEQGTYTITEDQTLLLNDLGMKWELREAKWDEKYYLLEEYYKKHGNIDVPRAYRTVDGIKLGTWLTTQRTAYKGQENCIITEDQIQLLNDLNIDWSPKNTKILSQTITNLNIHNYNEILLARLNHVLDDIQYDGFNEMTDLKVQEEINAILVKRIWR